MPTELEPEVNSAPLLVTFTTPPVDVPEPLPPRATKPAELPPLPPPPPIDCASIALAKIPCVVIWPEFETVAVEPAPPPLPLPPIATRPAEDVPLPPPPPMD